MVINMDPYIAQDRLKEIWQNINSLLLSYLEIEDSPQKIEQRNKLEDSINDFLCLAPHNQKFCLVQTAEVLHRSASNKSDFCAYKAVVAWNAIGMYAGNLLAQPWRQEYRQIKTYSGFYKHQIEANLVGADVMFEAMGYKNYGDGILVLEGPVCPDRLIQVSQDSIMAYVECQILKTIWEEVSKNFQISWLDVLEFRETHLCNPKQCVQALNYRFHQRQYQEQTRSYAQGTEQFHGTARYPSASQHSAPVLPSNNSFSPLSGHMHMPAPATSHCIYANNGCYSTYGHIPQHFQYSLPLPYSHPSLKPQYPANGYYYTNGYPTVPPRYVYPVPTAQLIELEHTYDVPDGQSASKKPAQTTPAEANRGKNIAKANTTEKEEGSGTFESWDYVYRNLESQGYSKDLGERGDVLSGPLERGHNVRVAKRVKASELEDALAGLNLNRSPKFEDTLQKNKQINASKEHERQNSGVTHSSSYDNLSVQETNTKKPSSATTMAKKGISPGTSKTLPREKAVSLKAEVLTAPKASHSKTVDLRRSINKSNDSDKPKGKELKLKSNNLEKWNCQTCTFLNNSTSDICEICSKSKTVISQNIEVGGSECAHCTLINPKEMEVCAACSRTLKNSPTYI